MPFSYEVNLNSAVITSAGADRVVASVPIPEGGSLDRWSLVQRGIGTQISVLFAGMYGNSAYMCELDTPDSSVSPDVLWDSVVTKDTAVNVGAGSSEVDIDFDTANSDVELEPGVPDLQAIIEGAMGPKQVMSPRTGIVSFADSPTGFLDATPDTYLPKFKWGRRSTKKVNADRPSYALFGFSNPDTLATSVSWIEMDSAGDWVQLQYMEYVLEQAWVEISGLTESGAESPWSDAVIKIIEATQRFFEDSAIAGSWSPVVWTLFTTFRGLVTVPGVWSSKSLNIGE